MLRQLSKPFIVLLVALTIIPISDVSAKSVTVNNQTELKDAIEDSSISTITLGSNIETTEKINITRTLTIDGNGNTMKYVGTFGKNASTENTTWGGIYLLQIYTTEATIKDIKLTGGNAALLVNGSKVTLEGTIDVSGNGFGGIELGQGSGITTIPHLKLVNGAKIVNTTESENKPTLWVPEDTSSAILEINGVKKTLTSGMELTLNEIAELFAIKENPDTSDSIIITIILGLSGLFMLILNSKKTAQKIKKFV